MYATDYEPLYIGKADWSEVIQRVQGHRHDGVERCVKETARDEWGIKVACLDFGKGQKYSSGQLDTVESLLIHAEYQLREFCQCNESKTKSYNPKVNYPIIVINEDHFST